MGAGRENGIRRPAPDRLEWDEDEGELEEVFFGRWVDGGARSGRVLLSMTGYGAARQEWDAVVVLAEIRTVNNRFLKCSLRLPEGLAAEEARYERLIRQQIARGTVSASVRIEEVASQADIQIHVPLLKELMGQCETLGAEWNLQRPTWDGLLALPGMVVERSGPESLDDLGNVVEETLAAALIQLNIFRRSEGEAMAADLRTNLDAIEREVDAVAEAAPAIVVDYRDRLLERVSELLAKTEARVDSNDLIREVSMFADRCDINEELTRLRSHLSQFRSFIDDEQSQGRKLDFLTQELNREVNTIGSKANNVGIAHRVVEMKTAVERIREVLQNVE